MFHWAFRVRINDPSLSWCIKRADKSVTRADSSVPLMCYDCSDLGSVVLIQMITVLKQSSKTSNSQISLARASACLVLWFCFPFYDSSGK